MARGRSGTEPGDRARRKVVGHHVDEVQDAAEGLALPPRELNGEGAGIEAGDDVAYRPLEGGARCPFC